jgi:hypothetical protein
MHHVFGRVALAAVISISCSWPAAAQDAAKGATLLAEARKALGSEDTLRAVKALDMKSDFKRSLGQNTIGGDLELRMQGADKLRRDEDLSPPGGGPAIVRTEVLNGTAVWDENSGAGGFGGGGFGGRAFGGRGGRGRFGAGATAPAAEPQAPPPGAPQGRAFDPAQREELQRRTRQADLARYRLMWLLDTGASSIAWVGTAEAPEGKADVLEVATADGPTRLFLDQQSHLPLMLTWQPAAAGRRGRGADQAPAQPPTVQLTVDDYKVVNGIKLPHHITRGLNGRTVEEWTVKRYKLNPTFKADVFNK